MTLTIVSSASAFNRALRSKSWTSDSGIVGVRATIGNPGNGQWTINAPDFFGTSIEANNGSSSDTSYRGIAQGIFYTHAEAIDTNGDCNSHTGNVKFYYTEIDDHNTYTCQFDGYASPSEPHEAMVQYYPPPGFGWQGYLDGFPLSPLSFDWDNCNHHACEVRVQAEEWEDKAGYWQGKYNGSITPWGYETAFCSCWTVITQSASAGSTDPYWTQNLTNMPAGLWGFTYSK